MANKQSIIVNIDRPRRMRFSTNAMIVAEELSGLNILDIDLNGAKAGFKAMLALIFAALWADDNDLTLQRAGELADEYEDGVLGLFEKAAEAIAVGMGGGNEKNANRPEAKQPEAEPTKAQEN